MSPTASVILIICVLIITAINLFFLVISILLYVRAKKFFLQIGSKGAALLGTILGATISFLGFKKSKVEKGGEKRNG